MVNFTEIIQTIKSLVETRIELVKSDIQDQLVGMLSRLILLILIGSIGLVSGLFLSLSLAFLHQSSDSEPLPWLLGCGALLFSHRCIFVPHKGFARISAEVQHFFKAVYF